MPTYIRERTLQFIKFNTQATSHYSAIVKFIRIAIKIKRCHHRLWFLRQCIAHDITPKSFRINHPIAQHSRLQNSRVKLESKIVRYVKRGVHHRLTELEKERDSVLESIPVSLHDFTKA